MSKQGCKTLRKMFVFMALFPPLRALPSVSPTHAVVSIPPTRLATRSPVPLFPPSAPPPLGPARIFFSTSPYRPSFLFPPPPLPRRVALHASVSLIPFFPPRRILSFAIPTRSPHSGFVREGPLHWMDVQASTAGRDHPHCRGHHFNVTLIKSNNQYLPRKKF